MHLAERSKLQVHPGRQLGFSKPVSVTPDMLVGVFYSSLPCLKHWQENTELQRHSQSPNYRRELQYEIVLPAWPFIVLWGFMTPAWLSARCFSQQLRFVMLECNTWLKQLESRSKASVLWIRPGGGCRNSQKLLSLRWRRVLCTPPPLLFLERGVPQVTNWIKL